MGQKRPSSPKREGVVPDDLRALRAVAHVGRDGLLRRVESVVVRCRELLDLRDVDLVEKAAVQVRVRLVQPVVSSLRPLQAASCRFGFFHR